MKYEQLDDNPTMAEKVFRRIKNSILDGEIKPGEMLPTEPELEKQFGVSRGVVRDAVRLLKGQGLVTVRQGKGMFVSESQAKAFADALLTTLRREGASVWDVEQFEQVFLPQAVILAGKEATEEEIRGIRANGERYLEAFQELALKNREETEEEAAFLHGLFQTYINSIFEATHNKFICLIGNVFEDLRKWRTVTGDVSVEKLIRLENIAIRRVISSIENRDPGKALEVMEKISISNPEAVKILKNTPIGESPEIPQEIFYPDFDQLEDSDL